MNQYAQLMHIFKTNGVGVAALSSKFYKFQSSNLVLIGFFQVDIVLRFEIF